MSGSGWVGRDCTTSVHCGSNFAGLAIFCFENMRAWETNDFPFDLRLYWRGVRTVLDPVAKHESICALINYNGP